MAIKKKPTTKKPSVKKKRTIKKIDRALNPTFKLMWKDNDGVDRSLYIGTMTWGSISPCDALNLEKLIGDVIKDYFNASLKQTKAKKKNVK